MASKKPVYRVRFVSDGNEYELYAKEIDASAMMGFVEVGGFVWGRRTSVIVDPSEQALRNEFDGVKRTYIPYQSIRRIDQVEKGGTGKVVALPGQPKVEAPPVPPMLPDPGKG